MSASEPHGGLIVTPSPAHCDQHAVDVCDDIKGVGVKMTEDYIDVYGGYAIKLLRLQNEMIQTFERYWITSFMLKNSGGLNFAIAVEDYFH
jgi:hypothetical protein